MTISFVGASGATTNNGASLEITPHASSQVGDLLVAHIGTRAGSGATIVSPGTWTQHDQQRNSGTVLAGAVFTKVATAGDLGGSTFGFAGANVKAAGYIYTYRGDTELEVTGANGQVNTSSTTVTYPSFTSSGHTARLLAGGWANDSDMTTNPSGFTPRDTFNSTGGAGGTRNRVLGHDFTDTGAGSTTGTIGTAAVSATFQLGLTEGEAGATEGSISQALPVVSQSLEGEVAEGATEGSIAQALSGVTQSLEAEAEASGELAQTLPMATQSLDLEAEISAELDQSLPMVAQSLAGSTEVGEEWWDATAEEWVSEETWNESSQESYQFPADAWEDGGYEWSVATKDQDDEVGPYADPFSLTVESAEAVTGAVSQTLPMVSQSLDAEVGEATGEIAQTLSAITQSLDATVEVLAEVDQSLPMTTQALSGQVGSENAANISQTLPMVSQEIAASLAIDAALDQALPFVTQAVEAVAEASAEVAQTLPMVTQAALGTVGNITQGQINQTLPMVSQALEGEGAGTEASLDQSLPMVSQSVESTSSMDAEVAQTLPMVTQQVNGFQGTVVSGAVGQTLPKLTQAVDTRVAVTSDASQTLPMVTQELAGDIPLVGTLEQLLPMVNQNLIILRTLPPSWPQRSGTTWPGTEGDGWPQRAGVRWTGV